MSGKPTKRIKTKPSWSDVKAKLTDFDRTGLTQLISDLYAYNTHNQAFLHARFGLGADALDDYKQRMEQALAPDISRRAANPSVATAKRALSDYTKAVGDPLGILELRIFWCETAVDFSMTYGYAHVGYFDALIRQFREACAALPGLHEPLRIQIIKRLDAVRDDADMGYGVGDALRDILEDRLANLPESVEEARVPMIGE